MLEAVTKEKDDGWSWARLGRVRKPLLNTRHWWDGRRAAEDGENVLFLFLFCGSSVKVRWSCVVYVREYL